MSFNMTGRDENTFYIVNSAIQVGMFFILSLPALLLCTFCGLALLCTKSINWQMKTLLGNLFIAEMGSCLGSSLLYLGYPHRALGVAAEDYFCKFIMSAFITTSLSKSTATTIYAVMVYIFVKHGIHNIQQYITIPSIIISWIVSISMGTTPYFNAFGVFDDIGFCESVPHSQLYMIPSGVVVLLVLVVSTTLTISFSSATYCHVKQNTLEENSDLRLAIAYNVVFLAVASIFTSINNIIPVIFPIFQSITTLNSTNEAKLAVDYTLQIIYDSSTLLLPVSAIILLKPIQNSLKAVCSTKCCHMNN